MQDKNYDYEFSVYEMPILFHTKIGYAVKGGHYLRGHHYYVIIRERPFVAVVCVRFFCQPNDDDLHSARRH